MRSGLASLELILSWITATLSFRSCALLMLACCHHHHHYHRRAAGSSTVPGEIGGAALAQIRLPRRRQHPFAWSRSMSLQESLNRFKKQQEKCQSILTDTISRPSSARPPSSALPHRAAPSSAASAPVAPVRFSSDTERLQHINAIRKSPAGAQIKRVIDLLLERRQALTPEQINEACYVDVLANKTVFDSLKNNHKVNYDGYRFSYKSKHNLENKSELLDFVRKFLEGIAVVDLKDAYPSVMDDLQACCIFHGRFTSFDGFVLASAKWTAGP